MLNTIASKILSLFFSEYIESLDSSQLEIAVWNGSVHFENVSVKPDVLIKRSIPFIIKKGLLGSLDLKFPWKHLSTESCEITIKNLLIVSTVSENFIAVPDISEPIEKPKSEENEEESVSKGGILTGLLTKIINNLKIHIENVHIRFEIPLNSSIFAFGILFDKFDLFSIDNNGNPSFVLVNDSTLKKLGLLEKLAIYFDTNSFPISIETDHFISEMIEQISVENHEFILNPFQIETTISKVKSTDFFNQNLVDTKETKKTSISFQVNSNELTLFLTRQQMRYLAEMSRQSTLYNLRKKYSFCGRPDHYPRSQRSSTYWWLYTYRVSLERSKKRIIDPNTVLQILKNRKEYLSLYMKNRHLNKTVSVELLNLEDKLDSHAITSLRVMAKRKYEQNLELPDLESAIELQNAARNIGPFDFHLKIFMFKIKLIDENRKTVLGLRSNETEIQLKKNKYSSFTIISLSSLIINNETNPHFPDIFKTDPHSDQQLIIALKSQSDSPFSIMVSSPHLFIVFDYKWITLLKQFLNNEKNLPKTELREKEEKNDEGKVPATVLELKKSIENYKPKDLNIAVNGVSIKVLYNENVEDFNLTLSVTKAHVHSPPHYHLSIDNFESLYDHYYIEFQDAMIHLNEKCISSSLIGKFHIQSSITSTDLFPCLKFEVDINNKTVINISTFECNLLCEFYEYFSDVLGLLLPEEGVFEPEKNYRIACVSAQLNMFYEDKQIYEINLNPLDIAFTFKNFQTYLLITMNKIKFYEYFSGDHSMFLDCVAKEQPVSISAKLKKDRRQMTLDLGKTTLYGNSKAFNFFINYLRFMDDYEVRLNLKDKPDPRNIWHTKFTTVKSAPMELSIISHPLVWHFENQLGKLKTDFFDFSFVLNEIGTDMFITANHPIIKSPQLKTILDTNDNTPLKFEFHPLSMSYNFENTKISIYIPWLKTFFGYISSLIHYGKYKSNEPGSISYNDIMFKIVNLEAKIIYNPNIDDFLTVKTSSIELKTPKIPSQMNIIVESLYVYYGSRLLIRTSQINIELSLKLIKFDYGEDFSMAYIKQRRKLTKSFLMEPNGDLTNCLFWITGMKLTFRFKEINVDYTHQSCHTFRKCISSIWLDEKEKNVNDFDSKFEFLMKVNKAHLIFTKIIQFSEITVDDFCYSIIDDDQNVAFGDISIVPLFDSDINYFHRSIFQNYSQDKSKPLLNTRINGNVVIITFNNLNVYLHPTFIFPFLYYIIDCPLFGEFDDPPRNPPLYLVFKSNDLHLTIPTKPTFYLISFKLHWIWGEEEFVLKMKNLKITAENRKVPILDLSNILYKLIPHDLSESQQNTLTSDEILAIQKHKNKEQKLPTELTINQIASIKENHLRTQKVNIEKNSKKRYTRSATFSELKFVLSISDFILLSRFFSLIFPTWDISHFVRDNSSEEDEFDIYDIDYQFQPNKIIICHTTENTSQLLPFMQFNFDECKMISMIDTVYFVKVSVHPTVLIMNCTRGSWDYMIEPFTVNFLLKFFKDHTELSISILDEININISSVFIQQILQFKSDFLTDFIKNSEECLTFITLENRTGRPISFYSESLSVRTLDVNSSIPLPDFPENQFLNIVLGDPEGQVCGFKPETIIYPTFIHQCCLVNSIPSKGARLITLQSPFAINNKTSIHLEIYVVNQNNDRSLIGIVKSHSVFSIPYHVFLNSGFIFKKISTPWDTNHEIFRHKKWGFSLEKSYPIVTSHGPLWCKLREEIDPVMNIGYVHIIPSVTFYNEMPVTLYVQMKRSINEEIILKPGENVDVAGIAPGELNFKCTVKIDGYSYSKQKMVFLSFDTPTKKLLRKFILIRDDEKKDIVGIALLTNHSIDKSQAAIIFYTPCVIFNMFGRKLLVSPRQEDVVYRFHHFSNQSKLMTLFTSSRFFKNSQLYANLSCPGLSTWSEAYIDCLATGMNDVIFLPKENNSNIYVPIHYKVTQAEKPYFHTHIVTLVPALSIENELDDDLYLEPDFSIQTTNMEIYKKEKTVVETSDESSSTTIGQIKPMNRENINDYKSCKSYNPLRESNNQSEFNLSDPVLSDKISHPFREIYPKHKKTTVVTTNYHFSFSLLVPTFNEIKGILLSAPVRTCFRLFKDDNSFQIIELEIVEDGLGLCAHFRKAQFPTQYIFCNYLHNVTLYGYQFNHLNKFVFSPKTTTMFALDAPFGEQNLILVYNNQSIIISLNEEINSSPLIGTPFMIKIIAVDNGNQMIIVSEKEYVSKHKLYSVFCGLQGISISIIDSLMREFMLINFNHLNLSLNAHHNLYHLSISLNSFQIDDQCIRTAFPVAVIGSSTNKHKFLKLKASIIRGVPFLIAFKHFSFQIQKILIYADLAFLSDIFSLTLDTLLFDSNNSAELKSPIQIPEQSSVGQIYSFKKFIISPILFEVYYRSVTGRDTMYPIIPELPLTMFKLIGNITGANICLNCIILKNFRAPFSYLRRNIVSQYTTSLMSQLWSLAGHSDILLNTIGIAESFSSGIKTYYYDPDMFDSENISDTTQISETETTTDFQLTKPNKKSIEIQSETSNSDNQKSIYQFKSKSKKHKTKKFNSDTEKIVDKFYSRSKKHKSQKSISDTEKPSVFNESEDKKKKEDEKRKKTKRAKKAFGSILQSGEGFLRGVSSLFSINSFGNHSLNTGGLNQTSQDTVKDGIISFGSGFFNGITGVVMDPVNGGKKDGVKGAFIGIGKGLAGVVMKPLAGLLDVGAGMIGGMRQAINNADNIVWNRHRIPRRFHLNKIDVFDPKKSLILIAVFRKAFNDLNEDKAMCAYVDDAAFKYVFCLCDDAIYLIDRKMNDDVVIKKIIQLDRIVDLRMNGTTLTLTVRKLMKKNEVKTYVIDCGDYTTSEQIITMINSYKISQNVF